MSSMCDQVAAGRSISARTLAGNRVSGLPTACPATVARIVHSVGPHRGPIRRTSTVAKIILIRLLSAISRLFSVPWGGPTLRTVYFAQLILSRLMSFTRFLQVVRFLERPQGFPQVGGYLGRPGAIVIAE